MATWTEDRSGLGSPLGEARLLTELQAMRRELAALRRLFDEFAGAYLNAQFPFGKPVDRWRRRG